MKEIRQARKNAYNQVIVGFCYTSGWYRKWREIFYSITKRSVTKPKQTRNNSFLFLQVIISVMSQQDLLPYVQDLVSKNALRMTSLSYHFFS